MNLRFQKYQGAGNDFIVIDSQKQGLRSLKNSLIRSLCDRKYGIGSDGLILLKPHKIHDFEMLYYNADGEIGSMCGNGGRCAIKAARRAKYFKGAKTRFIAYDGFHKGVVKKDGTISLSINEVDGFKRKDNDYILDTGSPHYVQHCLNKLNPTECLTKGKEIRYMPDFGPKGINVNFINIGKDNNIDIITYERGVENLTLACGTGTTAAACVWARVTNAPAGKHIIKVQNPGGLLKVKYDYDGLQHFTKIWLMGPAELVYNGSIKV